MSGGALGFGALSVVFMTEVCLPSVLSADSTAEGVKHAAGIGPALEVDCDGATRVINGGRSELRHACVRVVAAPVITLRPRISSCRPLAGSELSSQSRFATLRIVPVKLAASG